MTTQTRTLRTTKIQAKEVYALEQASGIELREAIGLVANVTTDNFVFSHPYGASSNADLTSIFIVEEYEVYESNDEFFSF